MVCPGFTGSSFEAMRLYPSKAVSQRISGRVDFQCDVGRGGKLNACEVIAENPKGFGFGEASLRGASRWTIARTIDTGNEAGPAQTRGARVVFSVAWTCPRKDQLVVRTPTEAELAAAPLAQLLPQAEGGFTINSSGGIKVYPAEAVARRVKGKVVLMCLVEPDRRLACVVREARPEGMGFQTSALRLASFYTIGPEVTVDGVRRPSVGARLEIKHSFDVD
jgi:hypothetical protein